MVRRLHTDHAGSPLGALPREDVDVLVGSGRFLSQHCLCADPHCSSFAPHPAIATPAALARITACCGSRLQMIGPPSNHVARKLGSKHRMAVRRAASDAFRWRWGRW